MNILVVGGDSFVAQNFIKNTRNKYKIKIISREKTDFENEIVLKNFFKIEKKVFNNFDIVFNCAGIVHRKNAPEKLYKEINYKLVDYLIEKSKKAGIKKFIQMSTISVYGRKKKITTDTREKPINIYGISKHLADKALLKSQDEKFKVIIVRSPMIYGAGAPGNMMKLIKFVDKSLILPFKRVYNKRSFIYIKNLVYFINKAIEKDFSGKLLVSDKKPISTEQIINLIRKQMDRKNIMISIPSVFRKLIKKIKPNLYWKLFDNLIINNKDILKKLEINIPYKFEDGIEEMIEDYLKNKKNN